MTKPMTITTAVDFRRQNRGRRRLKARPKTQTEPRSHGRVPRVSRLMALAIRFESQVRSGVLANFSVLALLGYVTRARVSQIVNLINLPPDIQEAIL